TVEERMGNTSAPARTNRSISGMTLLTVQWDPVRPKPILTSVKDIFTHLQALRPLRSVGASNSVYTLFLLRAFLIKLGRLEARIFPAVCGATFPGRPEAKKALSPLFFAA